MGPYAYKESQWVGYDTIDYVKKKARFINNNELGGAMFWDLSTDDFNVSQFKNIRFTHVFSRYTKKRNFFKSKKSKIVFVDFFFVHLKN